MSTRFCRLAGILVLALAACDHEVPPTIPMTTSLDAQLRAAIGQWGPMPILAVPAQDPAMVALGRALFFDPILSGNRDVSCATCHSPTLHAGDGLALAVGTGATGTGAARRPGPGRDFIPRHAPSLLNQGLGIFYSSWDGQVSGHQTFFHAPGGVLLPSGLRNIVAAQAMLPVANRAEMRGQPGDRDVYGAENELATIPDDRLEEIWRAIMRRLVALPAYGALFDAAFPTVPRSQLTFRDAANAIAVFQLEHLTRADSPFDRYLARNDFALTTEQKQGALLFFGRARCSSCHSGPFLGASGFANVGVPQIGPGMNASPPLDLGRGELESHAFYRFAFRVAPLRNVELTAPYMHDGAYATLEAVIEHYDDVRTALRTYDPSQLPPELRSMHHGDAATVEAVLATLDPRVSTPLMLTEEEKGQLVAFLRSLTDPSVRDLGAIAPSSVPSGLPMRH